MQKDQENYDPIGPVASDEGFDRVQIRVVQMQADVLCKHEYIHQSTYLPPNQTSPPRLTSRGRGTLSGPLLQLSPHCPVAPDCCASEPPSGGAHLLSPAERLGSWARSGWAVGHAVGRLSGWAAAGRVSKSNLSFQCLEAGRSLLAEAGTKHNSTCT